MPDRSRECNGRTACRPRRDMAGSRRLRPRRPRAAALRGMAHAHPGRPISAGAHVLATTWGSHRRSSEHRVRRPRPLGSCHQCCTSPSTNCRDAARSRCALAAAGLANVERHDVLQLIAESEGAAGLISSRNGSTAGRSASGTAASGSSAHRTNHPGVRTCTASSVDPMRRQPAPRASSAASTDPCRRDQTQGARTVSALADQEQELATFAGAQNASTVQRRARVQPGTRGPDSAA